MSTEAQRPVIISTDISPGATTPPLETAQSDSSTDEAMPKIVVDSTEPTVARYATVADHHKAMRRGGFRF